jgi:hypothetical protein
VSGTSSREVRKIEPTVITNLEGPWEITFPSGLGAPEKITMPLLESLSANADEGVKYFSGTASYTKTFTAPKQWFKENAEFILDLGNVGDLAEVFVNGQFIELLWSAPFRTNITPLLKKGTNTIEIKVTNQWTNRLAGDQRAEPGKKVLNSPLFIFRGRPLNESGLIGPVTILKQSGFKGNN